MDKLYTKAALFTFLKKGEERGYYNGSTARGRRAAATALLEDLEDSSDVRGVDADDAAMRYHNRHPGELSSGSLAEYKGRLVRLLAEFADFNQNPAGYRPKARTTPPTSGATERSESRSRKPATTSPANDSKGEDHQQAIARQMNAVQMLRLSYPIRADVLAEVAVPRGMTVEEAKRLSAFIMTLASDFIPS